METVSTIYQKIIPLIPAAKSPWNFIYLVFLFQTKQNISKPSNIFLYSKELISGKYTNKLLTISLQSSSVTLEKANYM